MQTHDRILVVEDNASIATILGRALEEAGYDVQVAGSGARALEAVSQGRPDLVVLDVMLPDMNGYDLCQAFRRLYGPSAVPILMLTAMDRPLDQLRGFAYGADAYLTKPCQPGEIITSIGLLLSGQSPLDQ